MTAVVQEKESVFVALARHGQAVRHGWPEDVTEALRQKALAARAEQKVRVLMKKEGWEPTRDQAISILEVMGLR